MSMTLQVIYPVGEGTTFDFDYYLGTHMKMVGDVMGEYLEHTLVTKGLAGGPNTPPGFHAIASLVFPDKAAMDAALPLSGPLNEDIPNFTNAKPHILIGEVIG